MDAAFSGNFKMVAKTLYGFEPLLERELMRLGARAVKSGVRNVSFEGDMGFLYKANLSLRTALRILVPIHHFQVRNERDLYNQVNRFPWELYLGPEQTLAIDSVSVSPIFKHSLYLSQKVKDAIVDRFRTTSGKRPSVDTKQPDIRVHVHMGERNCTLSFDSSGSSLHLRGYRSATNIAPINEVLAAGLLLHSGWDGRNHFLDPMCGSGTLLIEAAMIACQIPANMHRKTFGFQSWKQYDPDLFQTIYTAGMNRVQDFAYSIRGYDKAPSAVQKAVQNIENAGLSEYIQVEQLDFFKSSKSVKGPLHMVFNPPYGERLHIQMPEFYKAIGDTLKQGYPGTEAWFITSDLSAMKHVGLRPSRKIKVYNGQLEARLLKYEIYEGSKKGKYQEKA